MSGRAQLAAEAFADGLETIPIVLAENAGMDPIDTQVRLRAKISAINNGRAKYGVDVLSNKVADLTAKDIYEPLSVKEQVMVSGKSAFGQAYVLSCASCELKPPNEPVCQSAGNL